MDLTSFPFTQNTPLSELQGWMRKFPRINAGVSVVSVNDRRLKAPACLAGDLSENERRVLATFVDKALVNPPHSGIGYCGSMVWTLAHCMGYYNGFDERGRTRRFFSMDVKDRTGREKVVLSLRPLMLILF